MPLLLPRPCGMLPVRPASVYLTATPFFLLPSSSLQLTTTGTALPAASWPQRLPSIWQGRLPFCAMEATAGSRLHIRGQPSCPTASCPACARCLFCNGPHAPLLQVAGPDGPSLPALLCDFSCGFACLPHPRHTSCSACAGGRDAHLRADFLRSSSLFIAPPS